MNIRELDPDDRGYVISSWREGHKQAPKMCRVPWSYYKYSHGALIKQAFDGAEVLGAYVEDVLIGYVVFTRGKRVHTLHWLYVKKDARKNGIATALLEAADLGKRFAYTLEGPKHKVRYADREYRSVDLFLVAWLRARGTTAVYSPLKDFLA